MNQFLKLRSYTSFVRKFCGGVFTHSINDCIYYSYPFGIKSMQVINSNCMPYFHYQVREFAKKAQGKMSRGGKAKVIKLTDEEMAEVIDIDDYCQELQEIIDKLKKDYIENLTIRPASSNIINLNVKIGEEEYPLNELAVISKKNLNLISINMADFPEAIKPAIQAIIGCGSGFNPQQEGTMIYITVPKMTREHRETLAKNAKSLFVKSKAEIKIVQNSFIKVAKEKTELSEDLVFNATNQIMAKAGQCAADLEKMMKDKQKELLGDS